VTRVVAFLLFLACWAGARPAWCDVQRFAVIIGNDRGSSDDVPLRYAASDAAKVAAVLRDVGGVQPANLVVLRNESAATVRSTLITFNDRIRSVQASPATQTLLFVYYSGHADARALRLGGSLLPLEELTQLVRGSAATFRLLVVDACRSGALTRVKGGRIVAPFALTAERRLPGEGMVLLTASAANEDAQESDELRGSFFTQAFVSGLLGAADTDNDGAITLDEAYRHAYDGTLRATSRTFAGAQHPTFQLEVRGHGALVLTEPGASDPNRAQLEFPKGLGFLVMADDELGTVIAEVTARNVGRKLSVRPGRYFVRGRAADALLEGTVEVAPKEVRRVDVSALKRLTYARLVRKGARASGLSHGAEVGFALRSTLPNASGPCGGAVLGYRLELESVTWGARFGFCTSSFQNSSVRARTNEYFLSLAAERAWDLPSITLSLGGGVGGVLTTQTFETLGSAPSRLSMTPLGFVVGAVSRDVSSRVFISLEARAEAQLIRLKEDVGDESSLALPAAVRGAALVGTHF
jgi:Caspase domain